jgi:hypothetical protein
MLQINIGFLSPPILFNTVLIKEPNVNKIPASSFFPSLVPVYSTRKIGLISFPILQNSTPKEHRRTIGIEIDSLRIVIPTIASAALDQNQMHPNF